jgi:protoporphyrinogen oxidase
MKKDKASRICIIGAGAAGLVAAKTLKEMGYEKVSILEREPIAGGKCCSYQYDGKSYELGAGLIARNNKIVYDLAEEFNIPLHNVQSYTDNLYDIKTGKKIENSFPLTEKISFFWQLLIKYRRLCHQYESLSKPGYVAVEGSLAEYFSDWAPKNGISLIEKNLERYFTGFGYGYWEEIPAAYVLKYIDWESVKSFMRGQFYTFPTSIQSLWIAVAAQLNVEYNCIIKSIRRTDIITIETNHGIQEYDYLLISSPLDDALNFMAATQEEQTLFSQIIYNDYQCYAYSLDNFPDETGFLLDYLDPSERTQPMFWYKPTTDSDFYTFYVLSDWKTTEEQIRKNIEKVIATFGGTIKKFHVCRKWKYFPRCSPENMRNGFYDKIENLQGQNKTYFIGELPSYSTVELTAEYAKHLVETHF